MNIEIIFSMLFAVALYNLIEITVDDVRRRMARRKFKKSIEAMRVNLFTNDDPWDGDWCGDEDCSICDEEELIPLKLPIKSTVKKPVKKAVKKKAVAKKRK